MKRMSYIVAAVVALVLGIAIAFASPARAATVNHSGEWGTCPWEITDDGTLIVHPGEGTAARPWRQYASEITSVVFVEEDGQKVIAPASCNLLLAYLTEVTSIDLSGLDTSRVTSMNCMFDSCTSLAELDLSGLDTSRVTSMELMFFSCTALGALNLSGLDTSQATTMYGIFYGCSALHTLDLTGFDTSGVRDMGLMFGDCASLATIRVGEGWTTDAVATSNYMFYGCTSLVGGNGTEYSKSHMDARYAHIDAEGNPGYFTA